MAEVTWCSRGKVSDFCVVDSGFNPRFRGATRCLYVSGCMLYACGVGYFGLLSIVILSAIAVERYMVITAKPLSGSWKMTQYGARKVISSFARLRVMTMTRYSNNKSALSQMTYLGITVKVDILCRATAERRRQLDKAQYGAR
uniref:(California timema) hypothetical protein n=1 Tax=Timema californicum TaxID=61474 RepID=A0A7R9J5T8_TIMCA|nr:unnamed protein product [Timema californicum]